MRINAILKKTINHLEKKLHLEVKCNNKIIPINSINPEERLT